MRSIDLEYEIQIRNGNWEHREKNVNMQYFIKNVNDWIDYFTVTRWMFLFWTQISSSYKHTVNYVFVLVFFLKTVPEILIAMQVYCLCLDIYIYIYVLKFRGIMLFCFFSLILCDTKLFFNLRKLLKLCFGSSLNLLLLKGSCPSMCFQAVSIWSCRTKYSLVIWFFDNLKNGTQWKNVIF